jgi:hypothetical protein
MGRVRPFKSLTSFTPGVILDRAQAALAPVFRRFAEAKCNF